MAEFEPYSFEPMRDLSDSEEEQAATQDGITRRGNTAWCSCDHCENWENQQERECVCCQEIDEVLTKIAGEYCRLKENKHFVLERPFLLFDYILCDYACRCYVSVFKTLTCTI